MGHRETVDSLCSIICKMAYIIEQQDQVIEQQKIPLKNDRLKNARIELEKELRNGDKTWSSF